MKKGKPLAKRPPGSLATSNRGLSKQKGLLPTVERRGDVGSVVSGWYRDTMETMGFHSQADNVQGVGEVASAAAKAVESVTQYNIAEAVGKKKVRIATLDADIEIAERERKLSELKEPAVAPAAVHVPTEAELREQERRRLEEEREQTAGSIRAKTKKRDEFLEAGDRPSADLVQVEINVEQDRYRDACERLSRLTRVS